MKVIIERENRTRISGDDLSNWKPNQKFFQNEIPHQKKRLKRIL